MHNLASTTMRCICSRSSPPTDRPTTIDVLRFRATVHLFPACTLLWQIHVSPDICICICISLVLIILWFHGLGGIIVRHSMSYPVARSMPSAIMGRPLFLVLARCAITIVVTATIIMVDMITHIYSEYHSPIDSAHLARSRITWISMVQYRTMLVAIIIFTSIFIFASLTLP